MHRLQPDKFVVAAAVLGDDNTRNNRRLVQYLCIGIKLASLSSLLLLLVTTNTRNIPPLGLKNQTKDDFFMEQTALWTMRVALLQVMQPLQC